LYSFRGKIYNILCFGYNFIRHRYLIELFGTGAARLKLCQIMGVLVELRELCETYKEEELQRIRLKRRS
jgi:hypothetical protein